MTTRPDVPATRTRYGVVAFASILAVLTYVDRVCISKAEAYISADFKLSSTQMGYVFAAFTWGYALFEVPGGWLGDRIGAKKVLTRIVIFWSFFTAATGLAWNYLSLLATRFLFGAGEAGCFPNVTKALKTWLPAEERVRAQSIVWLSARWGGAFTPLLVVWLLNFMTWRTSVAIFGTLGLVWAVFFHRWYRDNPRDHKSVNPAELALIEEGRGVEPAAGPTPWGKLLLSRSVVLLCLQYMCLNYAWFFYVTWLPKYLIQHLGVDGTRGALLNALPLFMGGVGCLVSGFAASRVIRWTGDVRRARRWLACSGFGAAALLLLVSLHLKNPLGAMIAMGFASFANDFAMPVSWTVCMDLGGRHTGTLSGVMNMLGAFAAGCAPIITGEILDRTGGNWAITFYVSAALYLLGLCCWLFLDPVTPLLRPADPKPEGEPA